MLGRGMFPGEHSLVPGYQNPAELIGNIRRRDFSSARKRRQETLPAGVRKSKKDKKDKREVEAMVQLLLAMMSQGDANPSMPRRR